MKSKHTEHIYGQTIVLGLKALRLGQTGEPRGLTAHFLAQGEPGPAARNKLFFFFYIMPSTFFSSESHQLEAASRE